MKKIAERHPVGTKFAAVVEETWLQPRGSLLVRLAGFEGCFTVVDWEEHEIREQAVISFHVVSGTSYRSASLTATGHFLQINDPNPLHTWLSPSEIT